MESAIPGMLEVDRSYVNVFAEPESPKILTTGWRWLVSF
jgi:hypothetical protein